MSTTTMHLRSPAELLTAIPYILGFRPTDSLVAVALTAGRVGLTCRIDPPRDADTRRVLDCLLPPLAREAPDRVILVAYTDSPGAATDALDVLAAGLREAGIGIHDRLLVTEGRWRSIDCTTPGCCPPDGTPLDDGAKAAAVAAEFVGHGIAPLPDRATLAAQLDPGPQADAVGRLLERTRPRRMPLPRVVGGLWSRILDPGQDPPGISAQDAAWAAWTLRYHGLRDGLIGWLTPGQIDPSELAEDVRSVLAQLGRAPERDGTEPGPAAPVTADPAGHAAARPARRARADRHRRAGVVAWRRGPGQGRPRTGAACRT